MRRILFTHAHLVVDGNKEYLDGALLVNGETIEDVFVDSSNIKKELGEYEEVNLQGKIVMPGFFDTHTHGVYGVEFNKASKDDINKASEVYAKHGATSFFTTLTNNDTLKDELVLLSDVDGDNARLLGIHLEGPFISRQSKGVLEDKYIYNPSKEKLEEILDCSNKIKQMTVAPELNNVEEVIDELNKRNIRPMFGHSKATSKDTDGKDFGGFTHLFNAMSGFNHRDLGLVNVAFNDNDKYAELICDSHHVDVSVLKIAMKCLRRDRIIMISDSIAMAGIEDGEFIFENELCYKEGTLSIRKKDGRIAGSAGFISDGIKVMASAGASLTDLLLMTSLNAYRHYNLDQRFGSLVKGKYADIVILDNDLNVVETFVRGKMIHA